MPEPITAEEFASRIRQKYPGDYDNASDEELTQRVLAKYPQYKSQVTLSPQPESQPGVASRFLTGVAQSLPTYGAKLSDVYEGPLYAIKHPIESAKLIGGAMVGAQQEVIDRAYRYQHTPGVKAKVAGLAHGIYASLPFVGPALSQAAEKGQQGDIAGELGMLTGLAGQMILADPEARGALVSETRSALRPVIRVGETIRETLPSIRNVRAIRAAVPEAAGLPNKALLGAEDIFRAAAPVGSRTHFRSNLYAAANDLAEVGRTIEATLKKTKGGIVNPDMRMRATVNALDDHLQMIETTERAPQIARNANNPVVLKLNPDAVEGLNYMARSSGKAASRSLAEKAAQSEYLTLDEANQLERAVNPELRSFRKATAEGQYVTEMTSKNKASLEALDNSLKDSIETELISRGETGLKNFRRRYAALSDLRDQLERRLHETELRRMKLGYAAERLVVFGRKPALASASQSAIADVNTGRLLQRGFKQLSESGIGIGEAPTP